MSETGKGRFLYTGSWEHDPSGEALGIRACRDTGKGFEIVDLAEPDACVGAMTFDRENNILYFVNEKDGAPGSGTGGGSVFAFKLDDTTGKMEKLSEVSAGGSRTSDVTIAGSGNYLLVTNHGGKGEEKDSGIVVFRREKDGSIGAVSDRVSCAPDGAEHGDIKSHPHCVRRSPIADLYCVCDKGTDAISLYTLDETDGTLCLCPGSPYRMGKGCSPRYCVFHPTLPVFYINFEGKNELTAFHYEKDGTVSEIQSLTVISKDEEFDFKGGRRVVQSSDIRLHPDGTHLYNITRGVNVIDVYQINGTDGKLEHVQAVELPFPKGGMDTIRSFAFSADASLLAVGGLTADSVIFLETDENDLLHLSENVEPIALYHPAALFFS